MSCRCCVRAQRRPAVAIGRPRHAGARAPRAQRSALGTRGHRLQSDATPRRTPTRAGGCVAQSIAETQRARNEAKYASRVRHTDPECSTEASQARWNVLTVRGYLTPLALPSRASRRFCSRGPLSAGTGSAATWRRAPGTLRDECIRVRSDSAPRAEGSMVMVTSSGASLPAFGVKARRARPGTPKPRRAERRITSTFRWAASPPRPSRKS